MQEFLSQTWPWYVSGPLIALTMFLMLYFGKSFGVSSNLITFCSAAGAGKRIEFFNFKWKENVWNLVFILGMALGGFLAASFLTDSTVVNVSSETQTELNQLEITNAGLVPNELFGWEAFTSLKGIFLLILGGFLVGFGARYAGGCTSGHAISGLSNLQIPSLISVLGFFIGGLFMVHVLFKIIL